MAARSYGTFVISWSQSEVDGLHGSRVDAVEIGSTWRWSGQETRIDDPSEILVLDNEIGASQVRAKAARHLRRILGDEILFARPSAKGGQGEPLFRTGFEITDGHTKYLATLIELGHGQSPLLLFRSGLPPKDRDLWVTSNTLPAINSGPEMIQTDGTICFTTGTWIRTIRGPVLVEDLQEGDQLLTKDNGPKAIRWIGSRTISGGRLIAMPHLRPVRIRAHALGDGEPDTDLMVSPDHRLIVKGPIAQSVFNRPEVLVTARDLINDHSILPDYRCRGVSYIHLMLDHHQIVWANGVEVESFHPAGMSHSKIDELQRQGLYERFPDISDNPFSYGEYARRSITQSEAAILTYGMTSGH